MDKKKRKYEGKLDITEKSYSKLDSTFFVIMNKIKRKYLQNIFISIRKILKYDNMTCIF